MRRLAFFFSLLAACGPLRVPFDALHRVGRFEEDGRFQWSASRFSVRFEGSGKVRAQLRQLSRPESPEGPPQPLRMHVDLDGAHSEVFAGELGDIVYEAVVPPGDHRLTLVRQSEALVGEARLEAIELPADAKLKPWKPQPLLEFIGDSVTVGYGVEGVDPCKYSSQTQAITASFPWLVGASLKADVRVVGWSGRGVTRNWGDRPGPTVPELWTPAEPQPDLVFIALGANDHWSGDPGPEYAPAYLRFVERVRAAYPGAQVFTIVSGGRAPLVPGTIELKSAPADFGHGCVGHPNTRAQRWFADQIIEHVCRVVRDGDVCGGAGGSSPATPGSAPSRAGATPSRRAPAW
jgi:hypothetical protein